MENIRNVTQIVDEQSVELCFDLRLDFEDCYEISVVMKKFEETEVPYSVDAEGWVKVCVEADVYNRCDCDFSINKVSIYMPAEKLSPLAIKGKWFELHHKSEIYGIIACCFDEQIADLVIEAYDECGGCHVTNWQTEASRDYYANQI